MFKETLVYTAVISSCFVLISSIIACDSPDLIIKDDPKEVGIDQCLRSDLFKKCLEVVPKGPEKTKYNDWDEVISECGTQAFYNSLRQKNSVKPECYIPR